MDFSPFDESLLATCSGDETVSSLTPSFPSFICSSFPFPFLCIDLVLFCWCILTHKSTFHPLRLCCSWQGFGYDMNLLVFLCYLNLLKALSSQHIILSHRCPSLLESAESGSASSDSAARFTSGSCVNTHNYCHTQTFNTPTHAHTHIRVVCSAQHLQRTFIRLIFCQQGILFHPLGCAEQANSSETE